MTTSPYHSSRGLTVERYSEAHQDEWDRFITAAKNATFLFQRAYMDYHSDRFADHSLLIRNGAKLVGVLPANLRADGTLVSHQGLTYGGFVLRRDVSLHRALAVVHAGLGALHAGGIAMLTLKRIPRLYCTLPDDEIDYAMFLVGARLAARDVSLTSTRHDRLAPRKDKRAGASRGRRMGVRLVEGGGFSAFWRDVLAPRLMERFGARPVHTLAEIELLAARFPANIRLFSAFLEDRLVAGVTVYETPSVAHLQYTAINAEGESASALDTLLEWLVLDRYADKQFFDFGTCSDAEGRNLNHGLLRWKEGFGARSCVHDVYDIRTANFARLEAALAPPESPGHGAG